MGKNEDRNNNQEIQSEKLGEENKDNSMQDIMVEYEA